MQSLIRRRSGVPVFAALLTLGSGLVGLNLSHTGAAAEATSRNPYTWPFSSDSIWNMPVGSGATFSDPNFFQPPNGYGTDSNPIIMAPSSPLRPVHTHAWPARCYQSGDPYSGVSIPIPDGYIVAPGDGSWEGNMPNLAGGILLGDGRTIREFNYLSRCSAGGPISLTGDGLRSTLDLYGNGRPSSFFGGHGGSGLSGVGGSIRRGELTGAEPIRHATKLTVDMSRWGSREGGRNAYQWPAYAADSENTGQTYGVNASGYIPILKMGSLLSIPGWVDVNAIGLETGPARKLAQAWQDYGSYIVDNSGFDTGWGQNLLNVEHGVKAEMAAAGIDMSTYSSSGWADTAWNRDMNRLFDQLRHVTNNSAATVGGGGTPRVALAPPFATASSPAPDVTTTTSTTTTTPAPTTTAPVDMVDLIRVSDNADRSNGRALRDTAIDSQTYVFVNDPGVTAVSFTLDGVDTRSEAATPFDFEQSTSLATPLRQLSLGPHRIGARMTLTNGNVVYAEAGFTRADAVATATSTTTTTTTIPTITTTTTTTTMAATTTTTKAPRLKKQSSR